MSVKIHNFAGIIGWNARKYLPRISSACYLKYQYWARRKASKAYIEYFMQQEETPLPLIVSVETINRCNSTCSFCPANKNADKRPYKRMDDALFYSIIDQLADWGFHGYITLYGNNEPWLDTRLVEFHQYARKKLPDAFIFISSNGLLLTVDKVKEIIPYINQLIINNYCLDRKLHDNLQEIYDYIKAHPAEFQDVDIVIQMRYLNEVLTNRAGSSPNKQNAVRTIKEICVMPYTDMWILPDGRLGICCCDDYEVTNLADLHEVSLRDGWNSEAYQKLRQAMQGGRHNYPFCAHCDFVDAGIRMDTVNDVLQHRDRHRGSRQSMFPKKESRK